MTKLPFEVLALIAVAGLFTIIAFVALASGLGVIALPFEMYALVQELPVLFPLHMVASAITLLLAPLVIATRAHAQLHRPLGRILGVSVVIGGLTALPVAVLSHSSVWARAGFFTQGLAWLTLLGFAIMAIRRRQIERHAILMMAMVAITSGAVWFRLITGTAIALQLPFTFFYALASWIAWIMPLSLVWLFRANLIERVFLPIRPAVPRPDTSVAMPAVSIPHQTS